MIVRDNHAREKLNQAARERLKTDRALPTRGVLAAGREYASGDRVIARRNDRHRGVDNGTLGTVLQVNECARQMLLRTDSGQLRKLDFAYVSEHVEHSYALTGHGAQGATGNWAAVIGRPEEFTREWAYTALLPRAPTHHAARHRRTHTLGARTPAIRARQRRSRPSENPRRAAARDDPHRSRNTSPGTAPGARCADTAPPCHSTPISTPSATAFGCRVSDHAFLGQPNQVPWAVYTDRVADRAVITS